MFLAASSKQKEETAVTGNTVSFSGQGKVLATPDIAVVSFAIVTESPASKKAQDDNSDKSKAVTDFLKKQNIEDKDIKTTSYNIFPQYNFPRDGVPQIRSYQVNQSFEVKVRDLDKVSAILDGLVANGANQVNNLGFQINDPEELQAQARKMAIENAKAKANTLKDQLDIKLGRIVNFSENTGGFPPIIFETFARDQAGGVGGGPSLPTGENEVVVNVTITYQIK